MTIYKSAAGEAEILSYYDQAAQAMGVPLEDRFISTRFGQTHLLVAGPEAAPPLVIFHGGNVVNPVSLWWFEPLMQHYRVYAPDTIGHPGKSAQTRLSGRDNSYGEWAADILDGLGLDKATLIGPSHGAGILLRAAAVVPERIAGAVLIVPASIATSYSSMMRKVIWPMLKYMLSPTRERLVPAVQSMFTERADDAMIDFVGTVFRQVKLEAGMPRTATKAELVPFKAPTLVIAAENDVFFPGNAVLRRAAEIFPNLVGAELIRNANHYPGEQGLAQINAAVLRFLEQHT